MSRAILTPPYVGSALAWGGSQARYSPRNSSTRMMVIPLTVVVSGVLLAMMDWLTSRSAHPPNAKH